MLFLNSRARRTKADTHDVDEEARRRDGHWGHPMGINRDDNAYPAHQSPIALRKFIY
jgi:hypothetical protein